MKNSVYRIILMIFVSLLFFIMLFSFVFSNNNLTSTVTSQVNNVVAKVDSVVSVPFTFFTKSKSLLTDFLSTYSENVDLKRSISTLENQSILVSNLQDENNSLKAALKISDDFKEERVITSEVTVRSSVSWLNVLTVDAGNNKGVTTSMVATSNGGAIGFVSEVSGSSSTVVLLSDAQGNNKLAASVSSSTGSTVFGIISSYDENNKLLEMTQLNTSDKVQVGSEVVTSGLDSVSVKNVPIGTVESIIEKNGDRILMVKPYADFDDISYVSLIGSGS